jgi:hypothetical protein
MTNTTEGLDNLTQSEWNEAIEAGFSPSDLLLKLRNNKELTEEERDYLVMVLEERISEFWDKWIKEEV